MGLPYWRVVWLWEWLAETREGESKRLKSAASPPKPAPTA